MNQGRNKIVGAWGEEQACLFLQRKGFTVVERNYHATVGELDIVATKGSDYYFIEVKTRAAGDFANDLAITPAKRRKFEKTMRHYCYHRNVADISLILAGLLVVYERAAKKVQFRLAAYF